MKRSCEHLNEYVNETSLCKRLYLQQGRKNNFMIEKKYQNK